MNGWIKLYRQLQNNPLWVSEPFTRGQAWVDLLLLANHKPSFIRVRGVKVNVDRGQIGMSHVKIAERWHWSRGKVKRFLNELEIEQQIEQQNNNISCLISIVNYDRYQSHDTPDGTASEQQAIQQTSSKRYTNKNVKNIKNEKKRDNNSLWEADANPQYLDFCERYYLMLEDHKKVTKSVQWKTKKWYDSIRLLVERDGVTMSELEHTLTFLNKNLLNEFCPQVWSTASLREKWLKVKAYQDRQGQQFKEIPQFDSSTPEGRKAKNEWFNQHVREMEGL